MTQSQSKSQQDSKGTSFPEFLWWLMTTLAGLAFAGGSFWLTHINNELNRVSQSVSDKTERLSRLEEVADQQYRRLDRIENKIDSLITIMSSNSRNSKD